MTVSDAGCQMYSVEACQCYNNIKMTRYAHRKPDEKILQYTKGLTLMVNTTLA